MGRTIAKSHIYHSRENFGYEGEQENQRKGILEYLIKWKDHPMEDSTWMTATMLQKSGVTIKDLMERSPWFVFTWGLWCRISQVGAFFSITSHDKSVDFIGKWNFHKCFHHQRGSLLCNSSFKWMYPTFGEYPLESSSQINSSTQSYIQMWAITSASLYKASLTFSQFYTPGDRDLSHLLWPPMRGSEYPAFHGIPWLHQEKYDLSHFQAKGPNQFKITYCCRPSRLVCHQWFQKTK